MSGMGPIMIVEDEPALAELLADVLGTSGYRVLLSTPSTAVERLASERPALLLIDYTMPGLSGAEVLAEMRDRVPATPPVILITGRDEVRELAQGIGADGYLRKPFEMDDLLGLVRRLLDSQ